MQRRHFRLCVVSSIKLVCNQFLLTLDKIIETSNILLFLRIFSLVKRILSKVDVKAFYFNPEIHLKALSVHHIFIRILRGFSNLFKVHLNHF